MMKSQEADDNAKFHWRVISLEDARLDTLQKKKQPPSQKDMLVSSGEVSYEKAQKVILHAEGLEVIPSFEKFIHLQVLDLSCNKLTVIEKLQDLSELRELKLYGNEIQSIMGLENLTQLRHLELQHNKISSIGNGLSSCTKLVFLRLDNNNIEKITREELNCFPELSSLDISHNKLQSIEAVHILVNLQELSVARNRLKAVEPLSACKKLFDVDVSYNKLESFLCVKGLKYLTTLRASHNQLTEIISGRKKRLLEFLDISHNQIEHISTISTQFPNLEVLNLSNNKIKTAENMVLHRWFWWMMAEALAALPRLGQLCLAGNPILSEIPRQEILKRLPSLFALDEEIMAVVNDALEPSTNSESPADNKVICAKQVGRELKQMEEEIFAYKSSILEKFSNLQSAVSQLPVRPDKSRPNTGVRLNHRSRIEDAKLFSDTRTDRPGSTLGHRQNAYSSKLFDE